MKALLDEVYCLVSGYLEEGGNWKLHPDWVYCEYNYAGSNDRQFDTPENNMRHFLDRLSHEGVKFNWGSSRFNRERKKLWPCPIFFQLGSVHSPLALVTVVASLLIVLSVSTTQHYPTRE